MYNVWRCIDIPSRVFSCSTHSGCLSALDSSTITTAACFLLIVENASKMDPVSLKSEMYRLDVTGLTSRKMVNLARGKPWRCT